MSTAHTVAEGEHLSGIADRYGFRDPMTIWNHADNATLKQQRVDPHVLHPGDLLRIPDKTLRHESRPTDKAHRFRVDDTPLKLRLALKDFDGQPIAGLLCLLTVDGVIHQLTSDGNGVIETPVPKGATGGTLKIPDLALEQDVLIGHLDPLDEASGWQARLVNLGYYGGAVQDGEDDAMRDAIEEFQCDCGLPVNGELDGATRARLKEMHGV